MNKNAPVPPADIPDPPEWLSARGADWFRHACGILAGMEIISSAHVDMLAIAASRYDEILECVGIIEDLGRTYVVDTISGSKMYKARPEVAMKNEAMRHFQSLLAEFGLSPASLGKVSKPPSDNANPFAEFA